MFPERFWLALGSGESCVPVSSDIGEHIRWLKDDIELGVVEILLHQVGCKHPRLVDPDKTPGPGMMPDTGGEAPSD